MLQTTAETTSDIIIIDLIFYFCKPNSISVPRNLISVPTHKISEHVSDRPRESEPLGRSRNLQNVFLRKYELVGSASVKQKKNNYKWRVSETTRDQNPECPFDWAGRNLSLAGSDYASAPPWMKPHIGNAVLRFALILYFSAVSAIQQMMLIRRLRFVTARCKLEATEPYILRAFTTLFRGHIRWLNEIFCIFIEMQRRHLTLFLTQTELGHINSEEFRFEEPAQKWQPITNILVTTLILFASVQIVIVTAKNIVELTE